MEKEGSLERKQLVWSYFIIRVLLIILIIAAAYADRWTVFFINVFALGLTFIPAVLQKSFGVSFPEGFELIFLLFLLHSLLIS